MIVGGLVASAVVPLQAQQTESSRRIISSKPPVYPVLARSIRLDGSVKLRVSVAPSGAAKSIKVLGGNPVLSRAAEDAVTSWKWAPAAQESEELVNLSFHP